MSVVRHVSFQYELLDRNNIFKKNLRNIESCSISYKFLSQLKSSANIVMTDDSSIDYLNDRIKAYITINKQQTPLGVFLMSTPSRDIKDTKTTRNITCYSLLQILLDDKIETRLTLPIGTNVVNEVKRQIGSNYSIADSTQTLLSEKIFEVGTSKLEIINDLLSVINYNSLRVDVNGIFITEPYLLPTDRTIDKVYEEGADSIIISDMTDELDLFNVPNVIVRYTNAVDIDPPLVYTYVNDNASSITSTVNRGRRIVDSAETDASDMATLQAITKKDAYNYNSIYSHLDFRTAIDTDVLDIFMPTVWVRVGDINDKYSVTSIEFKCDVGELAKVESRKVVNI